MKANLLSISFVAMLAFAAPNLCAQQPPPNDGFANRIVLSGSSFDFTGTTYGASFEPNDPARPNHYPIIQGTVWWSWTPSADGYALLTAPGASPLWETGGHITDDMPVLAVFAADSLQGLAWDSKIALLDTSPDRYISFRFVAGQTYSFELFGYSLTNETIRYHLESSPTPVILQHPQSQTVRSGDATIFTALCPHYGTNLNVQWQRNGVDIPGAVSPSLLLTNITTSDAGEYRAIVNTRVPARVSTSQPATLTVTGSETRPYVWVSFIPGDANNVWVNVYGETNQHYTLHFSTNFSFSSTLIVGGVPYDPHPFLAHAGWASFHPQGNSQHWFVRAERAGDLREACLAKLRRIDFAKEAWRVEARTSTGAAINQGEVDAFIDGYNPSAYGYCPLGGFHTYNNIGTPASCEIHGSNP